MHNSMKIAISIPKELIERYENGYRKHPESISEIKAIEALSAGETPC